MEITHGLSNNVEGIWVSSCAQYRLAVPLPQRLLELEKEINLSCLSHYSGFYVTVESIHNQYKLKYIHI